MWGKRCVWLWGWEEPCGSIFLKEQDWLRCFWISSGTGERSLWDPLIFHLSCSQQVLGWEVSDGFKGGLFLVKGAAPQLLQGWSSSTYTSDSHKYISRRHGRITTNENFNYMYRSTAQPRNFQRKCIYPIWPPTDVHRDTHICIFCFCVAETL